jgi:translocation and assembly module TamB
VRFNLLSLLWSQTLPLDIRLEDVDVTIPQLDDGNWATTDIRPAGEPGLIKIQLNRIEIEGGQLTVEPQPKPEFQSPEPETEPETESETEPETEPEIIPPEAITLRRFSGEAEFSPDGDRINFNATGYHNTTGRLNAQGEFSNPDEAVNLNLSAQFLQGEVISPWIPAPLMLDGGEVFGNISMQLATSGQNAPLNLQGNLRFEDLDLQLSGVPQPILDGSGQIRLQNNLIGFENISASYGESIPMTIPQGLMHLEQGYEIPIVVPPTDWQTISDTLELEFPVDITGELEAVLQVIGPIDNPRLVGEARNTDVIIVDRLPFSEVQARFGLLPDTSEFLIEQLTATPAEGGGEVQAAVRVELPQTESSQTESSQTESPQTESSQTESSQTESSQTEETAPTVEAEFIVRNASADAIARRYDLPTSGVIGNFNARGTLQTAGEDTLIRLPIIEIAGGRAQGGVVLENDTWVLQLATQTVSLASLVPQDISQPYGVGGFSGQLRLGGEIGITDIAQLEAIAEGQLELLGSAIPVQAALQNGNWETVFTAENLTPPRQVLPQPLANLPLGAISGSLQVAGTVADLESFNLANLAGRTSLTTRIAESPLRLEAELGEGVWQAQLITNGLPLSPFVAVPPEVRLGTFAGRAALAGDVASLDGLNLETLEAEIQGQLTVNGGQVEIGSRINQGVWQAELVTPDLPLSPFVAVPPEVRLGTFAGRAALAGDVAMLDSLSLQTLEGVIQGQLTVNGGQVEIASQIAQGQMQGEAIAQNVTITPFIPNADLTPSLLSGRGQFRVPLANPSPETLTAQGQLGVVLAEGGLTGNFQVNEGNWLIDAEQLQIPLMPFVDSPVALSPLVKVGEIARLTGSVSDLRPQAISGQLQVGFQLGTIAVKENNPEDLGGVLMDITLANGNWQVLAQLQNADLQELVPGLPQLPGQTAPLDVAGRLDGAIAVTGGWQEFTPINIAIQEGAMQVSGFQVGDRSYDPIIGGPITADKEGILVQLAGQTQTDPSRPRDGLSVRLTQALSPQAFALQLGNTAARGLLENKLWDIDLENFPLAMLNLEPVGDRGRLQGDLTATVTADPSGSLVSGALGIRDPSLGLTQADTLQGEFVWANQVLQLDDVELQQGESRYGFDGSITATDDPQFAGALKIYQGDIQQILEALRWFDLDDVQRGFDAVNYADTEVLNPVGVGIPEASLIRQLQRLVEIEVLLQQQQQAREEASPLPELALLQGQFSGDINLAGSLSQGIDFDFNLGGEDWQWDDYQIHTIATQGEFNDGVWDIRDLNLRANLDHSQETQLTFNGILGAPEQSGQFLLTGLPMSVISEFIEFPDGIRLGGSFDAQATLSGRLENPAARGEIRWNNGQINQQSVTQAQGGFALADGRLNFGAGATLRDDADPIRLRASLPLLIPGSTVRPDSNTFEISVNAQNEGLEVLTALTDGALEWLGGQGSLELAIAGERVGMGFNYLPLATRGRAEFRDAQFNSPQLPEPLTQVNGTLEFLDDTVVVSELTGQFRRGSVRAAGELPVFSPLPVETPLQVTFDQVELELENLYQGRIDGTVEITNSALFPNLGGQVLLTQGQVFIAQEEAGTASQTADLETPPIISYDNLLLELGRGVQIISFPVLNFVADGKLLVNGPFESPEPNGTIFLRDGQVNLFTTTFTLTRGENTATFDPQFGLDPILDVRLRAAVQETTRPRIISPVGFDRLGTGTEIVDPSIERGGVETVRIEAEAQGLASRLFEGFATGEVAAQTALELSSSPARSQTEILSLIGGGALGTLGQQDPSLVVASSAVLTQIQSIVGRALGYRDFRLFPAVDPRTSVLGLGAEVGVNLTDDFSASILTILDRDDSTRFSVRYRIDDNWVIRGSTDFDDDNRGAVEFQMRF